MTDQPAPVPSDGPDVTDRVIELLQQRRAQGIATYGHSLRLWDGRDNMQDLIEELADALQYAVKEQERRDALVAIGDEETFRRLFPAEVEHWEPYDFKRNSDLWRGFEACWEYLMERWKGGHDADDPTA